MINDPEYIFCSGTGERGTIVEFMFESNNTITLESSNSYQIFRTVDMIENTDGFQIVNVSRNSQNEDIKYFIVLSK